MTGGVFGCGVTGGVFRCGVMGGTVELEEFAEVELISRRSMGGGSTFRPGFTKQKYTNNVSATYLVPVRLADSIVIWILNYLIVMLSPSYRYRYTSSTDM